MSQRVLRPLRPRGMGWVKVATIERKTRHHSGAYAYTHKEHRIQVISECGGYISDADGRTSFQYHFSIAGMGNGRPVRPTPDQYAFALAAFLPSIDGNPVWWEEDNHHPGNARHIFVPTFKRDQRPCFCKDNEIITDPDGYTYSYEGNYDQEHVRALLGTYWRHQ